MRGGGKPGENRLFVFFVQEAKCSVNLKNGVDDEGEQPRGRAQIVSPEEGGEGRIDGDGREDKKKEAKQTLGVESAYGETVVCAANLSDVAGGAGQPSDEHQEGADGKTYGCRGPDEHPCKSGDHDENLAGWCGQGEKLVLTIAGTCM